MSNLDWQFTVVFTLEMLFPMMQLLSIKDEPLHKLFMVVVAWVT